MYANHKPARDRLSISPPEASKLENISSEDAETLEKMWILIKEFYGEIRDDDHLYPLFLDSESESSPASDSMVNPELVQKKTEVLVPVSNYQNQPSITKEEQLLIKSTNVVKDHRNQPKIPKEDPMPNFVEEIIGNHAVKDYQKPLSTPKKEITLKTSNPEVTDYKAKPTPKEKSMLTKSKTAAKKYTSQTYPPKKESKLNMSKPAVSDHGIQPTPEEKLMLTKSKPAVPDYGIQPTPWEQATLK